MHQKKTPKSQGRRKRENLL
jgi:hypothetical protein